MNTKRLIPFFAVALLSLSAAVAPAATKAELQKRFQDRYPQLRDLKSAGKVGDTFDGWIEAVKGGLDDKQQKTLSDENADRRELYGIIAKETGVTTEQVGLQNGARNYERAKPGEYFKSKDGQWVQKK